MLCRGFFLDNLYNHAYNNLDIVKGRYMPNWSKIDKVVAAYHEHGSQRKAAKALGMSRRNFRRYLDQANAHGYEADPGFKVTKVSKTLDRNGKVMQKSVVTKLAPTETDEVREGKIARRSTLYGADGEVIGEWIIRKPEDEAQNDFISALNKHFVENVQQLKAPALISFGDESEDDLALFMSIDEHLNMRSLIDKTGLDYGLEDAVNVIEERFEKIVSRTTKTKKALYVNLGDIFHQNDHMNVTPQSKNVLDSDQSFDSAADAAVLLHRKKVQTLLRNYDEVEIHGVAGNHDIDSSGWLLRCLAIAYENETRVSSIFHANEMFTYQHGNTMLGFHHGHRMKPDMLASAITDQFSSMYGQTSMRYLHTGHIHHDSMKDVFGGYLWHSHRTIAPKDWHSHSNGYITRRSMKSFVYNVHEGEVSKFTTSIV